MKKNSRFLTVLAISISAAIFCGIWALLAFLTGLIGWAGFAGCTTYFSIPKRGLPGFIKAICTNFAGIACGMANILLIKWIPALGDWGVWCLVVTFLMCLLSYFKCLDFCSGLFMGCFCTFAADGNWLLLLPSIAAGAVLGIAVDYGAMWLNKKFQNT